MTDEQVREAFSEIYNNFWNRYKTRVPGRDSEEWERMRTWSVVLQRKYPFMKEIIINLEIELDQRMRGRSR